MDSLQTDWSIDATAARRDQYYAASQRKFVPFAEPMVFKRGSMQYLWDAEGRIENPGFLDYRIPVASDLPMIDTVIVEVPNKGHPYGVRGVGETSIVPPLAAIANSVSAAAGVRLTHLPMSPPRVLKAIDEAAAAG